MRTPDYGVKPQIKQRNSNTLPARRATESANDRFSVAPPPPPVPKPRKSIQRRNSYLRSKSVELDDSSFNVYNVKPEFQPRSTNLQQAIPVQAYATNHSKQQQQLPQPSPRRNIQRGQSQSPRMSRSQSKMIQEESKSLCRISTEPVLYSPTQQPRQAHSHIVYILNLNISDFRFY